MKPYLLIFLTLLSIQSFGQAINLDPSDTVTYVAGTAINLDLRYSVVSTDYYTFQNDTFNFTTNQLIDKSGNDNHATLKNASARTSTSGNLDYTITGILTSDVVTVVSGSDMPTIPSNGTLRIAEDSVVYGVTITRSGATWAVIPFCEPIIINNNLPYISYDVSGNSHHATCLTLSADNITTQNNYFYLMQNGFNKYSGSLNPNAEFTLGTEGQVPTSWNNVGTALKYGDSLQITNMATGGIKCYQWVQGIKPSYVMRVEIKYKNCTALQSIVLERTAGDAAIGTFGATQTLTGSGTIYYEDTLTATTASLRVEIRASNATNSGIIEYYRVRYVNITPAQNTTLDASGLALGYVQSGNTFLPYSGNLDLSSITPHTQNVYGNILNNAKTTVGGTYLIENTESDYFGSGLIVGDTFVCAEAKTLNANNNVRKKLAKLDLSNISFTDFKQTMPYLGFCDKYFHKNITELDIADKRIINTVEYDSIKNINLINSDSYNLYSSLKDAHSFPVDYPLQAIVISFDHGVPTYVIDSLLNLGIRPTNFINYEGPWSDDSINYLNSIDWDLQLHSSFDNTTDDKLPSWKGFHEDAEWYTEETLDTYYAASINYYDSVFSLDIKHHAYPGGVADAFTLISSAKVFSSAYQASGSNPLLRPPLTSWVNLGRRSLDDGNVNAIKTDITNAIRLNCVTHIYGHPDLWTATKYTDAGVEDAGGTTVETKFYALIRYIQALIDSGIEMNIYCVSDMYDIIKNDL